MADLLLGTRQLLKRLALTPLVTVSVALIVAAGIAVGTVGYASVRALWVRPPDIPLIDRVVEVRSGPQDPLLSWLDYEDLRMSAGAFARMAAFAPWPATASIDGQSRNVVVEAVSAEYFDVLGLLPVKGRLLQTADAAQTAPPVIAISERLWRRFFPGETSGSEQRIRVNDQPFGVVGVVPNGYRGGMVASWQQPTDIWMPVAGLQHVPGLQRLLAQSDRERRRIRVKALISGDKSLEQARADVARVAATLDTSMPLTLSGKPDPRRWLVVPMRDVGPTENEQIRRTVTSAYAGIGLVMFVVFATIVSLMVARSDSQAGGIAVRSMLGASRSRLMLEMFAESGAIAVLGGVLGLWGASLIAPLVAGEIPVRTSVMSVFEPQLGSTELAFTAVLWLIVIVLICVPGWLMIRATLGAPSIQTIRVTSGWRGRSWVIGGQLAVSIIASMLALTAARQALAMSQENFGFDLDRIALATVRLRSEGDPTGRAELFEGVTRTVASGKGVVTVALSSGVPGSQQIPAAYLNVPGQGGDPVNSALLIATPNILGALGVQLSQGRFFDERDSAGAQRVVVVDQLAAQKLFGESNGLGRQLQFLRQSAASGQKFEPEVLTVVGVVANSSGKRPSVYVPISQHNIQDLWIVVAGSRSAGALVGPLATAISKVPDVTVSTVDTGIRLIRPELAFQNLTASLTMALAIFALVVGLMGLYGLLTHAVRRREREIGVRLALGATQANVIYRVVRDGMIAVSIALVAGVAFGVVARMAVRPAFLQAVPPIDIVAVFVVPIVVLVISLGACYVAARRAGRIDPSQTLRRS